jgi:citrate lyase subunit alpha/citrate CoA-transferase
MKGSSLPIRTIGELKEEAERICGEPQTPRFADEIVAVIKWVDGTVLDSVYKVIL